MYRGVFPLRQNKSYVYKVEEIHLRMPDDWNSSPNPLLLGREGGFQAMSIPSCSPSLVKRGGWGVSSGDKAYAMPR